VVVLNGTFTPGGIYGAAVSFQYGPTIAFASQTPPTQEAPGLASQTTSLSIGGMAAHATYQYRIVVSDTTGRTVYGSAASFHTP
jgi:hypothetical protein